MDLEKHLFNQSTSCLPEKSANPTIAYNSTGVLTNDNSSFSSVETLLLNIQGLLKVAVENARHRENQINCEKGEFLVVSVSVVSRLPPRLETIISS